MSVQPNEKVDSREKPSSSAVSLKVIIVGAGIGGLTAAIALRQQGHEVHIYEQSQLANEIGAAIHIVPNANSTLRRMGINHEERGAIKLLQTRYYTSSCHLLSHIDNEADSHKWQDTWLQAHRGHLHTHLKDVATSSEGDGLPARIYTSSRISRIDPHKATITLENGDNVQGNLVVGADGVRSVCRRAVAGPKYDSFPFGKSAFRFMVPRSKILEDPETREFGEALGSLDMFFSPEHKVIVYPCVNNTLLNIVCIHPAEQSEASVDSYNKAVSKQQVLEVFHEFNPKLIKVFEKCDSDTLRVWPLFDALDMPTFVKDRLALIGDAAHAFTPFIGQGGAMAIEDAVSLGVMLSRGVASADIPERLELYNKARHERATTIQGYSRIAGGDGVKPGEENAARLKGYEHALTALSHDEYHASTQILREYEWRKSKPVWHQPLVFGFMPISTPSSHQDALGEGERAGTKTARTVKASIKFKTSATLLRTLFPNKSYSFSAKDTVAFASLSIHSYRNVKWLGFHGFHQVSLEIHGVNYTKPDGSVIHGRYIPVMFRDSADAISVGREEFGYPIVFSEIDVEGSAENSYCVNLSWNGVKWASIWLKYLRTTSSSSGVLESASLPEEGAFVHKYNPGTTDDPAEIKHNSSQDLFIPDAPPSYNLIKLGNGEKVGQNGVKISPKEFPSKVSSNAGFEITARNEGELPTLYPFVNRLAELPVFEIVNASLREGEGCRDPAKAYKISS